MWRNRIRNAIIVHRPTRSTLDASADGVFGTDTNRAGDGRHHPTLQRPPVRHARQLAKGARVRLSAGLALVAI
jgi:hypothetical protein